MPTPIQQNLIEKYIQLLDTHIAELKSGEAETTYEIADFANQLNVHPRHLSNTIHSVLGTSPCDLYEERLLLIAKELILESNNSIASIAKHLQYDPSNFGKFFKQYEGITPKQFRNDHQKK